MTHNTKTTKSRRQGAVSNGNNAAPRKTVATFGLLLGSLLATGCTSAPWSARTDNHSTTATSLGLSQYGMNANGTRQYVDTEAKQNRLPDQYVAEARIGLAQIEQAIAAARAAELQEEATLREGLARVSAQRMEAEARERAALAEADKIQSQYDSKQNELWAGIASRERTMNSTAAQEASMIEALRKEREMLHAEMSSSAYNDYTQAKAQVTRLGAIRRATAEEGDAALAEMRENAQATQSRAAATVARLRSESDAVRRQSQARADELAAQITTIRTQSKAESTKLAAQAESLQKDAQARYNDTMARADALTEQGSQENYELKVNAARTELLKAKSEYDRLISLAQSTRERAEAEISRLQADAERIAYLGESNFETGTAELNAWRKNELAEISKKQARAERDEKHARADFVKAEAAARANAIRETAQHQVELADAEMKKIIAEAELEATRVRAAILEELARKQQAGSVEMEGKTGPAPEQPADLHDVPTVAAVTPVTPQIEPEHIAKFRIALARVMKERNDADAHLMTVNATVEESRSHLTAAKAQFFALSSEKLAIAEAMTIQSHAQFADLSAQATSLLALAEANAEQSIANAEAFRKEVLAEAFDLRASAKNSRETALAHAALLKVESTVVANNGESEAKALEATLDATRRRGDAEYTRLLVEADSIERSNAALGSQINAQIVALQRILEAELFKQDRMIESAVAVAEANYNEALVNADVFNRKSAVEIDRLVAQNNLQQTLAAAEIDHLRNLSYSASLKAEASVTRVVASARAGREQAEAVADASSATLRSGADIARAELLAQSRAAEARENAVRATFDARLVQVQSERLRDMTQTYRDDIFTRANLETSLAEAEAARSEMQERFAALKAEQFQLQRTARQNWDSRLAGMQRRERTKPPVPVFGLPADLENLGYQMITNVPTDRD